VEKSANAMLLRMEPSAAAEFERSPKNNEGKTQNWDESQKPFLRDGVVRLGSSEKKDSHTKTLMTTDTYTG